WVNTVSPTYANEIRTPTFGCGMEGVLNERRDRLSGIVNGVDYTSWDSATDPHIAQNFTPETVIDGKAVCKADVQRLFGLPVERPTFGPLSAGGSSDPPPSSAWWRG